MLIKLNGSDIELEVSGFNDLGELLEDIKKSRLSGKEFIADIVINGDEVPSEKFDNVLKSPLSEIESLEIKTANPRDVSLSTLKNLDPFLENLVTLLEQSADKFRMEKEEDANKFFISCVEGLQTFVGLLDKIKTLNVLDLTSITYESVPVSEKEDALLKVSNSLFNSQKSKDWVSLGDVLEYELVPIIKDWRAILPLLSDAISKKEN
ncbi:MAG: hypothetical protein V3S46_00750 [Nitrospinota bacterium]